MKTEVQLQQNVVEKSKCEPAVSAAQICVKVKNGIVMQVDHVNSYAEKWDAERADQRVSGVKALATETDATPPESSKRNDSDIAKSAERVLQWVANLLKDGVNVFVERGWISLSGEVNWQYRRQAAVGGVGYLMGINGIRGNISIKYKVTSSAVKTDIEAALKRRARQDTQKILVDDHGAGISSPGTVDTWSERDLARHHAAWGDAWSAKRF